MREKLDKDSCGCMFDESYRLRSLNKAAIINDSPAAHSSLDILAPFSSLCWFHGPPKVSVAHPVPAFQQWTHHVGESQELILGLCTTLSLVDVQLHVEAFIFYKEGIDRWPDTITTNPKINSNRCPTEELNMQKLKNASDIAFSVSCSGLCLRPHLISVD